MALLHSNIMGEGTPFLILHGFLGMSDNWKTLGKQFAEQGYQVHLIDQRNHGRSFHSNAFDYDLLASDLNYYVEQHQLKNGIVLGHSMGGKTAMKFATQYPAFVEKLIIADIAPKAYPAHHQTIIDGLNAIDFSIVNSRQKADEKLSEYVEEVGIRQFLLKNLYWIDKGRLGFRCNLKVLSHKMEAIGEALSDAEQFDGSTLFLKGQKSNYILEEDTDLVHHHFSNNQIGTIENAGHWLHAENPKAFFSATKEFLKS